MTLFKRLLENLRPWAEALEGIDDPRGEYVLTLESRVRGLERDVKELQRRRETGSAFPTSNEAA